MRSSFLPPTSSSPSSSYNFVKTHAIWKKTQGKSYDYNQEYKKLKSLIEAKRRLERNERLKLERGEKSELSKEELDNLKNFVRIVSCYLRNVEDLRYYALERIYGFGPRWDNKVVRGNYLQGCANCLGTVVDLINLDDPELVLDEINLANPTDSEKDCINAVFQQRLEKVTSAVSDLGKLEPGFKQAKLRSLTRTIASIVALADGILLTCFLPKLTVSLAILALSAPTVSVVGLPFAVLSSCVAVGTTLYAGYSGVSSVLFYKGAQEDRQRDFVSRFNFNFDNATTKRDLIIKTKPMAGR